MSATNPPDPNVNTFNNLYWITGDTALTQDVADKRYLRFPSAQGTENLQAINVNGIATFNNNIVVGSTSTANNTPTLTTNKTALILGTGGSGKLDVECPINIGGFGSLNLTTANINMNGNSIISQGSTNTTANSLGLTNMVKPLTMSSGTATDRRISSSYYNFLDTNTNLNNGGINSSFGNWNYDNDANSGGHFFYNNTSGGVQTNPLNFNSTNMTINTSTQNSLTAGTNVITQSTTQTTFNQPIVMNSTTSTNRKITSTFYSLNDNVTNLVTGSLNSSGGNWNYENDINGAGHFFYNNTSGGVQTNTFNFNTTDMTIATTNPPTCSASSAISLSDNSTKLPSTAWVRNYVATVPAPTQFVPKFHTFANYQTGTSGYSQGAYINWSSGWGALDYVIIRIRAQVNYSITSGEYNSYSATSGELIIRPYYSPAGVIGSLSSPNIFWSTNSGSVVGSVKKLIYYTAPVNNGTQSYFFVYGNGGSGGGSAGSIQLMCDAPGTSGGWQYTCSYEYILHTTSGASISFSNGVGTNNSLP